MATAIKPPPAGFVRVEISLDWSGAGHYDGRWQRACRCCGETTNLRDDNGEAAHKACVESEIEAKALAYAQSLLPVPAARVRRSTVEAV